MRVLVCGGRDFRDEDRLQAVLDKLHGEAGIDLIIQGGAAGADTFASTWAYTRGVPEERYDADWENHGNFAGPMRNQRMLNEGHPDLVIAFPRANGKWGNGTLNMIGKARKAGVEVIEIAP